jgi:hypothetical protein
MQYVDDITADFVDRIAVFRNEGAGRRDRRGAFS